MVLVRAPGETAPACAVRMTRSSYLEPEAIDSAYASSLVWRSGRVGSLVVT